MKRLMFLILAATSSVACASEAYVFPPGQNQVGDIVPREKLIYVLYTKEKCALPVVHASDMRRADIFNRAEADVGCWGKTLSGDPNSVVIVDRFGNVTNSSTSSFALADVARDGSANITRPSAGISDFRRRFPGVR
ncbi:MULTISPECIES: hypothetical protein [Pandoraea]|uniref:hypothetical protein n=1 Tax=Pandoraea TaxID=93217 RepID=UPI0003C74669|nr:MULTISPECIES: hypothetical protein [Pandoraea]